MSQVTVTEGNKGALAGLKIVDLSRILAGPFCTQILADHGADVLKVEAPAGDETRRWGPPFVDGMSSYFMGLNRNKDSIILDFSQDIARETLRGLLAGADIVVENFKAGTLEKWGFERSYLEENFPRLIHCHITGFGDDGPLGGMPGYDAVAQAMTGLMSVNGEQDGPELRAGMPVVDLATGLNATIGILIALQEREKSGLGQLVEVALFDCGLSILHPHSANFLASGKLPVRAGNAHPNITPYDTFETASGPVFLAVGSDAQFQKFCAVINRVELATDERFTTNPKRVTNREALTVELRETLKLFEADKLTHELVRVGVPCAPVLNVEQALGHPQADYRQSVWENGKYRGVAPPVRLSRTPAGFRKPPPEISG